MVLAEVCDVRRLHGDHAERRGNTGVDAGFDRGPLLLYGPPGNAALDDNWPAEHAGGYVAVRQVHPLEILRDTCRDVPGVDQPADDELIQRRTRRWPFPWGYQSGFPVIKRRVHHAAAQPIRRIANPDRTKRRRNGHRWSGRPGVREPEAIRLRHETAQSLKFGCARHNTIIALIPATAP